MKQGFPVLNSSFGYEQAKNYGELYRPEENRTEKIQSEKGNYLFYYDEIYRKITTRAGENPVSAIEALKVIEIVTLAFQSAKEGRIVHPA